MDKIESMNELNKRAREFYFAFGNRLIQLGSAIRGSDNHS